LIEAGINLSSRLGQLLQEFVADGAMVTCVAWEGQLRGFFTFEESIRPDAKMALTELRLLVPAVEILSGDNRSRAERLGKTLGVPAYGDLTPADKLIHLAELRRQFGPVAMIGDGLNDAPALAAADVSIALGCGADLSRDTAAICLLSNELSNLPFLLRLARQTRQVIKLNLFWAVIYNVVGVGLAASGWLNPIIAAVAMVASSTCVLANTLRLAVPMSSASSRESPSLSEQMLKKSATLA
jgi:P-type E1-E2 ATPase